MPLPALVLANIYLRDGRNSDAVAVAESIVMSEVSDPTVIRAVGRVFFNAGALVKAQEQFELAVAREPRSSMLLLDLTLSLMSQGRHAQALKHAEAAREASPDSAAIADTLGWIHRELGDYASGVSHLRDARKLMPGNQDITYHLAATLSDAGATTEARDILTELLLSQVPFASRDDAAELLAKL